MRHRNHRPPSGMTVAEMVSAMVAFGVIMTAAVTFFILTQDYYVTSSAQVDTLASSQQGIRRLTAELQETDSGSVEFSNTHDSLVFISARNSSGAFQTSNGIPNWQKWVFYELTTDPNGPYNLLIRKESSSIFGGLPSTSDQVPPGSWQTQFQSYSGSKWTVAWAVQTFQVQDSDCDSGALLHSPYYIELISTVSFRGNLTSYNPGYTANASGGCTSSGNWVQAQVINP